MSRHQQDSKVDEVFKADYLGKETRKGALVTKLNELHKVLKVLSQDPADRPEGLNRTAAQLISNKILDNPDKDLRLLASCCIVDVFRLFAPDAPYSDEEMVAVFEVIIAQLRGLSMHDPGAGTGNKIMYILNSLATVKTCVVPVILAQSGIAGAEDLVKAMFDALISSVRPEHGEDVVSTMSAVLQFCIDESEDIDQELLDILLSPLLPAAKAENPAAYNLVGGVLRRVNGTIQLKISDFVNFVLVGTAPSMIEKASELSDHIYPLIYELHKISPGLLLRVLPNVCEQLKAEEEEVRLRAVKLLGRLFASTSADYGADFGKSFREFMCRFVDVSKAVREEMVDQCALIMKRKSNLRVLIEERMKDRLRDSEADVREGALNKLIEAGLEDPLFLSVATFGEMLERVKDKKDNVQKTAVIGLARIYGKFVASNLPDLSILADNKQTPIESVRVEIMDRLKNIPGSVINCWGYPEVKSKHLIIYLIQEYLLPKKKSAKNGGSSSSSSSSQAQSQGANGMSQGIDDEADIDSTRATALLLMYSLLENQERDIFGTIMGFKSKVRSELINFLEARKAVVTTGGGRAPNQEDAAHLKGCMMRLYKVIPIADKKVQPLEKLHAMKDKTIYKLLQHALEPSDTITEGIASREDLKQRLDSKTQLSEYTSIVYDFASFFVVNEGILSALFKYVKAADVGEAIYVAQLLSTFAKHVPSIYSIAAGDIEEWVSALAENVSGRGASSSKHLLSSCLKTIELSGTGLAQDENSGSLCSTLIQYALQHSDAAICESFAKVASLLAHRTAAAAAATESESESGKGGRLSVSQKKSETATVAAITSLASSKRLTLTNKRLQSDLLVLGALLRVPNRLSSLAAKQTFAMTVRATRRIREPVLDFVREELFGEDHPSEGKKDKDTESGRANLLSAGLKAWAALLSSEEEVKAMGDGEDMEQQEDKRLVAQEDEPIAGVSTEMNELITILFECISSDGHHVRNMKLSGHTAAVIYSTAATSAMNLIKIKAVGEGMSVSAWMKLAWTLLHSDNETRTKLAENLFDILHTCPVHSRFLTYPCLLVTDDRLCLQAQRVLMFAVNRLRRTHEVFTHEAMADEDDLEAQRRAIENMPEMILPYLLYLLSYHPEFPASDLLEDVKDEKRLKQIVGIVRTFLKVLTESLSGEESNLTYLLKQINMISTFYEDCQDKDNVGLQFIMVLAGKILQEQIKSDEHVVEYKGDISLPMELFAHKPDQAWGRGGKAGKGKDAHSIETAGMDRVLLANKDTKKKSHRAARKRPVEVEEHTDDEGDDGADGDDKPKAKRAKKTSTPKAKAAGKAKAKAKASAPRDPGVLDRPKRQTTLAVVYREATENEQEVEEWEEMAAEKSNRSRTSIGSVSILGSSSLNTSKLSRVSAVEEDDDDDDDDGEGGEGMVVDQDQEEEEEEPIKKKQPAPASRKLAKKPLVASQVTNQSSSEGSEEKGKGGGISKSSKQGPAKKGPGSKKVPAEKVKDKRQKPITSFLAIPNKKPIRG